MARYWLSIGKTKDKDKREAERPADRKTEGYHIAFRAALRNRRAAQILCHISAAFGLKIRHIPVVCAPLRPQGNDNSSGKTEP